MNLRLSLMQVKLNSCNLLDLSSVDRIVHEQRCKCDSMLRPNTILLTNKRVLSALVPLAFARDFPINYKNNREENNTTILLREVQKSRTLFKGLSVSHESPSGWASLNCTLLCLTSTEFLSICEDDAADNSFSF